MCDFHAVDFLGFKNIRVFFPENKRCSVKKLVLKISQI